MNITYVQLYIKKKKKCFVIKLVYYNLQENYRFQKDEIVK